MVKEQYVTLKTAKLAKECGFNEECNFCYCKSMPKNEINLEQICSPETNESFEETNKMHKQNAVDLKTNNYLTYITAPSQEHLSRWFRENYKMFIHIYVGDFNNYRCEIWMPNNVGVMSNESPNIIVVYSNHNFSNPNSDKCFMFDTYENAMETGLQEALKILKNKIIKE